MLKDRFFWIYVGSVLLYNLTICFQGFDMCDEGWVMTGYQQIFNAPESVEYQFLYYGTLLSGGCWNAVFGQFGYIAFRFLSVLVVLLTSVCIYVLLKGLINRWCILLGMFFAMLSWDYGMLSFHHNYQTSFLVTCSCLFIYKALILDNYKYMFVAGVVIGCNVFSRLPNITMCILIFSVIPYYYKKRNLSRTFHHIFAAVSGFIFGVLAILILMVSLRHWDNFIHSLSFGFSATNDSGSTHNLSYMLAVYVKNYLWLLAYMLIIFLIPNPLAELITKDNV